MGAARPTARPSPVHPRGCRAASRPALARGTRPSCTAACPTSACWPSVPEWPWPRPESTVTPALRARRATAPSLGAADAGLRAAEGRRAPLGARHAAQGSRSTHTSDGLQPAGPPDREGPVLAALGSGGWAPTADKACVTPSRPVHLCPCGSHSCRAPRTWAAPQGPPLGPSERGPRPLAQWQTGRRTDRHVGRVHGGRAPPGPLRWLCVPPAGEGPGAAGGLGSPPPVPMPGSSAGLLSASSFKKPSLNAYPPPRRRRLRRKVPGPSCPAVRPQLREHGTPHRPCLAGQRRAGHPARLPTRWSLGHSAFST